MDKKDIYYYELNFRDLKSFKEFKDFIKKNKYHIILPKQVLKYGFCSKINKVIEIKNKFIHKNYIFLWVKHNNKYELYIKKGDDNMKTIKQLQNERITLLQKKQELKEDTVNLITVLMDQLFKYNKAFNLKRNEMIDFTAPETVKVKGRVYQILNKEYLMNGDIIRNVQYDNLENRRDDLYAAIELLNKEQEQQLQIFKEKNARTKSRNVDIRKELANTKIKYKIVKMYAIEVFDNLASICDIRDDVKQQGLNSNAFFDAAVESPKNFLEKIRKNNYICYVITEDKKLIEVDQEDNLFFKDNQLYLEK